MSCAGLWSLLEPWRDMEDETDMFVSTGLACSCEPGDVNAEERCSGTDGMLSWG